MDKVQETTPATKFVGVTKIQHEYKRIAGKHAAFRPVMIIDEAWSFLSGKA